MRKSYFFLIALATITYNLLIGAEKLESGGVAKTERNFSLIPPKKWQCIDDKEALPGKVDVVYVGVAKKGFTPSLNVATEVVKVPLSEYVALAKQYHESQPETKCYLLGTIESKAGVMQLMQIEKNSEWGNVRFLQAYFVEESPEGLPKEEPKAYVLTATCLEEEYGNYYAQFLQTVQSFEIRKKK